MSGPHRAQHPWIFCLAAMAVWLASGWPVVDIIRAGGMLRGAPVPALWLAPYALLGGGVFAGMLLEPRAPARWILLGAQLAAILVMTALVPWAGMSQFLVITAWQAAMAATPRRALGWTAFQTLAVVAMLAQALNPDLCWVIGKSFALQLLLVFTATALRRELETARALARTNGELRAAHAIIASAARDAERLRISRELHDAWGHELTALGLQLEIATHVMPPERAHHHVVEAKRLTGALLGKVRDVVSTLREEERCNLNEALRTLAEGVPKPVVHLAVAPGLRVGAHQTHALIRCAQEAITNAIRHANAANLWLEVTADSDGVRLIAHDDGSSGPAAALAGSGLLGMRERMESLGGRLAVRRSSGIGFTIDAWLPLSAPRPA